MPTRISRGDPIHRRSCHSRRPRNRRDRRNPNTHLPPPSRASAIDPDKSHRTLVTPVPAHGHVNPVS
jgi:hypothetical protein